MQQSLEELSLSTSGQGLYEVTQRIRAVVRGSQIDTGLCTVFVRHTSASLVIQENADPSAQRDLEAFINKLVPENYPGFTHTAEGPDDMPSHIKGALTATSLGIPVVNGELVLGTWQGIFFWEHRRHPHRRRFTVHVIGE